MNDHRAAGQELQSQVIAAARKGQQRAQQTVRQMTSAAQQIRPHLASLPRPMSNLPRPMSNLPRPTLNMSAMPGQAQLRERAPELAAKLHGRLPSTLQSRVPSPDQVKSSAQQFAGHARSVQRSVLSQVRNAASPLAQQAASRLSQISGQADQSGPTTTKVSQVTVTQSTKAKDSTAKDGTASASKPSASKSSASKSSTSNKPSTSGSSTSNSTGTSKSGTPAKPSTSGSSTSSGTGTSTGTSKNGTPAKPSTSGSGTGTSKSGTPAKSSTRSSASGSTTSAPKPRSKPTDK